MTSSKKHFTAAIADVDKIIEIHDEFNKSCNPHTIKEYEVLKRAALLILVAGFESYIENSITEKLHEELIKYSGHPISDVIKKNIKEGINRFNTPKSQNIKTVSEKFLNVDFTQHWETSLKYPNVKERIDKMIVARGHAAHNGKESTFNEMSEHTIKMEDLRKHRCLVEAIVDHIDSTYM